jgi:hypothetical protein
MTERRPSVCCERCGDPPEHLKCFDPACPCPEAKAPYQEIEELAMKHWRAYCNRKIEDENAEARERCGDPIAIHQLELQVMCLTELVRRASLFVNAVICLEGVDMTPGLEWLADAAMQVGKETAA